MALLLASPLFTISCIVISSVLIVNHLETFVFGLLPKPEAITVPKHIAAKAWDGSGINFKFQVMRFMCFER
jgi:hypothetical protein